MEYLVLESKLKAVEKQLNKIDNKCKGVIKFEILGEEYVEVFKGEFFKYIRVSVEGVYKINGWEFLAVLEPTANGNIIRKIRDDIEIPQRFRDCELLCEHCNTKRRRNDTYIIYNEETKEFKQVGKKCLKEYTNGLDSEVVVAAMSLFGDLEKLNNDITQDYDKDSLTEDEKDVLKKHYGKPYVSSKQYKLLALDMIKMYGYDKKYNTTGAIPTFDRVEELIGENYQITSSELELKEIDEFAEGIDIKDSNDYLVNSSLAWRKPYIESRDKGLVISFISYYLKLQQQIVKEQIQSETTQHIGEVGEKLEITVASAMIVFNKSNNNYSRYANDSVVWKIIDIEGNVFLWSTANKEEVTTGSKLIGKVKDHIEYHGEKQTRLTRCKIIK